MKIYIVSHYWDNGESYEDYRSFEEHFHFSTLEKASKFFQEKTTSFEGKWKLSCKELDTQNSELIEETSYNECHSTFWDWEDEEDYEPAYSEIENELEELNKLTQLQS